jgi:hypothetical protein
MNPRTTWALVLLAFLLGGWLVVTERRDEVRVSGADGSVRFRRLDPREVISVEILRSNVAIRLERTNSTWFLRAPIHYPVQSTSVERLLETLGNLVPRSHLSGTEVTSQRGALAAFGLERPNVLTIRTREGMNILRLGGRTPLGSQIYLQQVGQDGVFTADAALLEALPDSTEDWRDRRLFDADGLAFDRVEILGDTEFEAALTTNGTWSLVRPLVARANDDQIRRLLTDAADTRVLAFLSDALTVSADEHGLTRPTAQMVLKRGTQEVLRLQFGRESTNAQGQIAVRRSDFGNIVRITNSILESLRRPLAAYRDRRLMPSIAGLERLEVKAGGEPFTLQKQGTNWWVTTPRRFPADGPWVRETFQRFMRLRIEDFLDDLGTDPARYGLADPAREYAFHVGGSNAAPALLTRLSLGTPIGDGRRLAVRRSDESGIYGIAAGDLQTLPVSASQFRDWNLNPSNIVQIEIRQQGRVRLLKRNAVGRWDGLVAVQGVLPDPAIDEGLYRIGQAPIGRFPVPNEAALKQFAFDQLDHAVTLTQKEGGNFRTLHLRFGGRNAVNQFVWAAFDSGEPAILTQFPLSLYQEYIGPWLSAPPTTPNERQP